MIATVRTLKGGTSSLLCQLDILRFSQEAVLERMRERGIEVDSSYVCGFEDWGVKKIISLKEAYQLKAYIETNCAGDETLVKELLKRHWSVAAILGHQFEFVGEGDLAVLTKLFEGRTTRNIAVIVHSMGNCSEILTKFQSIGKIVATEKGFYLSKQVEQN